ncbi:protein transport protein bet1 [Thecaphora frezii]
MNRRAGAVDRHALLSSGAYPSSSRSVAPGTGGSVGYRAAAPFEQPYGHYPTSDPYAEYGNHVGAPKKETPNTTGANGGLLGRMAAYASQRTAEDLEEQNDQRLEGLSARVKMLKDITTGIGNEVREGTKDMGALSEAFSSTSAFLGGTMSRMNRMARRQTGWFCNMMLFLLFVTWIFVFLWWWRR